MSYLGQSEWAAGGGDPTRKASLGTQKGRGEENTQQSKAKLVRKSDHKDPFQEIPEMNHGKGGAREPGEKRSPKLGTVCLPVVPSQ